MSPTSARSGTADSEDPTDARAGAEDPGRFRRGFRRGVGAFSAFREALGETIHEARERGDFTVDRARDVVKDAVGKARDATSDARERFDFVTRGEFEALIRRVREMESRLQARQRPADEGQAPPGPDS